MRITTQPVTSNVAQRPGVLRRAWDSRARRFLQHYIEMIVAMFVGMFALGAPLAALLGVVGVEVSTWRTDAPELLLLGMAFTMSLPMAAWMRYRGHAWAPVREMTGSMFVPSLLAIGLLWTGIAEDSGTLLAVQHVGMFAGMLAVMLLRLNEYADHGGHPHAAD